MNNLSKDEEKWFVKAVADPVLWAETFLYDPTDPTTNLKLRSYQKEVLENTQTEQRIVIRYGRRMGKCLRGNSLIPDESGRLIKVKDYINQTNFSVFSLGDDYKIEQTNSTRCFSNGIKPIFKVKTKSGRYIDCTKNHPLLTISGWKNLEDLSVGDAIAVPSKIDVNSTHEIDDEKVKILAYLLSDGCITSYVTFGNENTKIMDEFLSCVNHFNCDARLTKTINNYKEYYVLGNKKTSIRNNKVINYLRQLDLFGKNSHTKFIPNEIMTLSKRQQILFLSRLFACDGWASVSKPNNCEIGYCSVSEELIHGVGHLLTRFGIRCFITEKNVKYKDSHNKSFSLSIRNKTDIVKFINDIGIFSKEEACENVLNHVNIKNDKETYFDSLPTQEVINAFNIKHPRKNNIRKQYKRTSKFKLLEYANKYNNIALRNLCSSNIFYDEIASITYIGEEETFDLEVFPKHNFVANDIIVHNSVVLCVDALWWTCAYPLHLMFTGQKEKTAPIKVLILTPMDSQIKMIFDTFLQLCAESPFISTLEPKIKRSDEHSIKFNNGSEIKGMTIGISSANKGLSARGQSCHYLFLDEADYIPKEVFEQSILPITNTNLDCKVRMCSTPSGKREFFYDRCINPNLGWWTRHYPSWHPDNPNWITIKQAEEKGLPLYKSTEYQFKTSMDIASYNREFGAEFGEELQGVYKHSYLDSSSVRYCPGYASDVDLFDPNFKQNPGNIYIIGVDWNTYINGGQIVMLEYCKEPTYTSYFDERKQSDVTVDFTGKIRMFYRRGVKSEEATQRETRLEIIRLIKTFKVDYVYVDYGAGDTNIEELTLYGKQHPELGISSKLRVVDAGSNIEHYDPVLQKSITKRAKSMMVNNSVNMLEQGMLVLPAEEDAKYRLVNQMRGYSVKTVTVRGDFTYEGEDHILDAFNLALHGFQMQYTILLANRYENKIRFLENPMMCIETHRRSENNSPFQSTTNKLPTRDPEKAGQFTSSRYASLRNGRSSQIGTGSRRSF